jgi:hypothetical protein
MGRVLLVAAVLACSAGVVEAGRTVLVETEPAGATVYIEDTAAGPACEATPCTIDAKVGTLTLIIQLEGYVPLFEAVDVPRKAPKKPLAVKFSLKSAVGAIVIDQPKGASVRVDDEDRGKVPIRISLAAGAYHVLVAHNGKTLYDEYVTVATGEDVEIATSSSGAARVATRDDDDDDGDDDDKPAGGRGGGSVTAITGSVRAPSSTPIITAGVAFDIGFRECTFDDLMPGSRIRDSAERGAVLAGPAIEVWPGTLLGVGKLRGLSLFLRAQFGLRGQEVRQETGNEIMGQLTTFWGSYELSVRHRWTIADILALEPSAGYVRDQLRFNATVANDLELVPDAEYQSVRIGVRLGLLLGALEPYVSGENRIVLSGGELANRFTNASATGLRGALGALIRMGAITARVEGGITRYTWAFTSNPSAVDQATGATDTVKVISFLVGYSY